MTRRTSVPVRAAAAKSRTGARRNGGPPGAPIPRSSMTADVSHGFAPVSTRSAASRQAPRVRPASRCVSTPGAPEVGGEDRRTPRQRTRAAARHCEGSGPSSRHTAARHATTNQAPNDDAKMPPCRHLRRDADSAPGDAPWRPRGSPALDDRQDDRRHEADGDWRERAPTAETTAAHAGGQHD